jgi:TPR repeat protein
MADAKSDIEDELSELEIEIKWLRAEIELAAAGASVGDSALNERPVDATANDDDMSAALRAHCKLQRKLGVAWHRQAELEELARIQQVRRDAVESGFVIAPTPILDECPLCLEPFHPNPRYTCCGASCCLNCVNLFKRKAITARDALALASEENNETEYYTRRDEFEIFRRCPFCRADLPRNEQHAFQMLMGNAQAGKAWAQRLVGERLRNGVDMDIQASQKWFSLAAQQGDHESMAHLSFAMADGETALTAALHPARHGNAKAQTRCGLVSDHLGRYTEALQWLTLAAAQDNHGAETALGSFFLDPPDEIDRSPFKAYYWLKRRPCSTAPWLNRSCRNW